MSRDEAPVLRFTRCASRASARTRAASRIALRPTRPAEGAALVLVAALGCGKGSLHLPASPRWPFRTARAGARTLAADALLLRLPRPDRAPDDRGGCRRGDPYVWDRHRGRPPTHWYGRSPSIARARSSVVEEDRGRAHVWLRVRSESCGRRVAVWSWRSRARRCPRAPQLARCLRVGPGSCETIPPQRRRRA